MEKAVFGVEEQETIDAMRKEMSIAEELTLLKAEMDVLEGKIFGTGEHETLKKRKRT